MDYDSSMINQIVNLINDIFSKHPSASTGREYGLTFNEILNDVNIAFSQLYPDLPPIQPNQLQQILKYQINGVNQFDTVIRNDGTVLYQISQQVDAYNHYFFEYTSMFSAEPPPTHYVTSQIPSSHQIPQIHQQFIPPIHPQQITQPNSLQPQSQPPIPQRGPPYSQQIPLQFQLQLHPTAVSSTIPNISIQNEQQQQLHFQQQNQIQFQQQPQPQYMPTTIEELTKEIHKEQKRIEELKKRQDHLMICNQLLQNPAQLKAVAKKMEQTVLYLKDMRSMVDDKVKDLVSYLDFVLNEK